PSRAGGKLGLAVGPGDEDDGGLIPPEIPGDGRAQGAGGDDERVCVASELEAAGLLPLGVGDDRLRSIQAIFGGVEDTSSSVSWVAAVPVRRQVCLGSRFAAASLPMAALLSGSPAAYILYALLAAALIWYRHHENIEPLLAGTEPTIGQRVRLS